MELGMKNSIVVSNHLYPTEKRRKFWRNECFVNYNYVKRLNYVHGAKRTGDIGVWKLTKLKIKI